MIMNIIIPTILCLIFGAPLVAIGGLLQFTWGTSWIWLISIIGPLLYTVIFILTAGLLSLPFQSGVVAGKFPRDLQHPIYMRRRLYGLCWTAVYYFKPLYYMCLSIPWLKWLLFRLFGYRGNMQFTIYPDTWIRDLPLLSFGENTYIANRATLGTNIALIDGSILVDHIVLGKNSLVGHLAMLAPGVELEEGAEVAVGCAIGIGCKIGCESKIKGATGIDHQAVIGKKTTVGAMSYVGVGAHLGSGISLPPASVVPSRTKIMTQEDMNEFLSSIKDSK